MARHSACIGYGLEIGAAGKVDDLLEKAHANTIITPANIRNPPTKQQQFYQASITSS